MADLTPPPPPVLAVPARARVVFDYVEHGERQHAAETGWAQIRGTWLQFLSDESESRTWQSWPLHAIVCVDWAPPAAGEGAP